MSEIEKLADLLRFSSSELDLRLDAAAESETAWLDVECQGRVVAVEWRPQQGFGVSLLASSRDPLEGLYEGPDEVLKDAYSARDRVLSLLEPSSFRRAAARR